MKTQRVGISEEEEAEIHRRFAGRSNRSIVGRHRTLAERLELHIHRTDTCWIWIGPRTYRGYGVAAHDRWPYPAHRVWWEHVNGKIPNGLFVCHKCDIKSCVNPAHLFLGTPKDNTQDMVRKRRHNVTIGETHPQAKLTNDQVREIRRLAAEGLSREETARRYGVCASSISLMVSGRTWKID